MHHQINAKVERILIVRCRQRAIDHRANAVPFGNLDQPLQIDHIEERVGRRFRQYQAGVRVYCRLNRIRVTGRHHRDINAEAAQHAATKLLRAAVAVGGDNHVLTGLQNRQEQRRHGTHARGPKHSVLSVIEFGDFLLGLAHGRIAVAAILAFFDPPLLKINELLGALKGICRRLIHGHRHGVAQPVLPLSAVHSARTRPKG